MLLLSVLFAVGCGGPRVYPVSGTIVLEDGSPLANMRVVFVGEVTSTAVSNEQGEFQMETMGVGNGAPAGEYRVLVAEVAKGDFPPPPRVHERYAKLETTPLHFTVAPGKNEECHLKLEGK